MLHYLHQLLTNFVAAAILVKSQSLITVHGFTMCTVWNLLCPSSHLEIVMLRAVTVNQNGKTAGCKTKTS